MENDEELGLYYEEQKELRRKLNGNKKKFAIQKFYKKLEHQNQMPKQEE